MNSSQKTTTLSCFKTPTKFKIYKKESVFFGVSRFFFVFLKMESRVRELNIPSTTWSEYFFQSVSTVMTEHTTAGLEQKMEQKLFLSKESSKGNSVQVKYLANIQ